MTHLAYVLVLFAALFVAAAVLYALALRIDRWTRELRAVPPHWCGHDCPCHGHARPRG